VTAETLVGFSYQVPVEALLTPTRLVTRHEQDRRAFGVTGESHPPFAIGRAELVNASQLWPKLLQEQRQCQNFGLLILGQRVEFRLKFVGHLNGPFHASNMAYNTLCIKLHIGERAFAAVSGYLHESGIGGMTECRRNQGLNGALTGSI